MVFLKLLINYIDLQFEEVFDIDKYHEDVKTIM